MTDVETNMANLKEILSIYYFDGFQLSILLIPSYELFTQNICTCS